MKHGRVLCTCLLVASAASASCAGRDYGNLANLLNDDKDPPDGSALAVAEAKSCIESAKQEASNAQTDRALDIFLIVAASAFSAAGTGLTTSSTFVSDTHNGGQPSDTRQDLAAAGAVSLGVGLAFLGLRTALNLGEISNARISASAAQAGLAGQIYTAGDAGVRDTLFAQCTNNNTLPNSSWPGASVSPIPAPPPSAAPQVVQPQPAQPAQPQPAH